jgi:hypothetical protein
MSPRIKPPAEAATRQEGKEKNSINRKKGREKRRG